MIFRITDALNEYYPTIGALFEGKNGFANRSSGQDLIVSPVDSEVDNGFIPIIHENQNCWTCKIALDANLDDPEVMSDCQDMLGGANGFVSAGEKLSKVLITVTLQEVVMSCQNLLSIDEGVFKTSLSKVLHPYGDRVVWRTLKIHILSGPISIDLSLLCRMEGCGHLRKITYLMFV